jgi:hypothetical protein
MATLANIFNRFTVAGAAAADNSRAAAAADAYRVRALPNEDVYFFVKRIDNSRVIRQADPEDRAKANRVLIGGALTAALLIGTLLPSAYGLIAGYQLNQLQTENQRLVNEKATLDLEEARLVSVDRLQALAADGKFQEPTPERVVYLQSKDDKSLALNRQ